MPRKPHRIAAIDVGTNSIHMIVVQAQRRGYRVIDREKEMVQLGRGSLGGQPLTEEAMLRGIAALTRMAEIAGKWDVAETLAVATSAVREAPNGRQFLRRIARQSGLKVRLISGEEEADLIYRAVRGAVDFQGGTALCVDIGGGSVELIVGTDSEVYFTRSIPLGALRVSQQYLSEDPPSASSLAKCAREVGEALRKSMARVRELGFDFVIGTSGTIQTLAELAGKPGNVVSEESSASLRMLRTAELPDLIERLAARSADDRAETFSIDKRRSESIVAGAIVLHEILRLGGVKKLIACPAALREGIVEKALEDSGDLDSKPRSVRHAAVIELAERCHYDRLHAEHVASLSARIFDQTQSVTELSLLDRELLEYGALLHEIGLHVSFERHHKHAYYLIRHAGLRGFTDDQLAVLANVARYHRKSVPAEEHDNYADLDARQRRTVDKLAAILRFADALDRSRHRAVRDVGVDVTNEKVRIYLRPRATIDIELAQAEKQAKILSKALEREVEILVQAGAAGVGEVRAS